MSDDANDVLTVLGGGPAGLATAFYARRAGRDVRVLEAADAVGGNTRTLRMGPFRFDTGAHRLHDKNPDVTADLKALLGDDLQRVTAPSQIYWQGRFIDFPPSPLDLIKKLPARTLVSAAREQLRAPWRSAPADEPRSFHELAVRRYGPTLAELLLLNYSRKLWGVPTEQLSPQVAGGRLQGLDFKTLLLEAVGGARTKMRHLDGSFYYPREGYGQIAETVADDIGRERIHTSTRVTRLKHDGQRIRQVIVNGERVHDVGEVVSTIPLTRTIPLLEPPAPAALQDRAEEVRFRHLRLAVLGIDRPRLSRNASLYFPNPALPFTRVYEPKNRSEAMAPAQQTALVVEVPCDRNDMHWQMQESEFLAAVKRHLEGAALMRSDEVVAEQTITVPFAYPILEIGAEARARSLRSYLNQFTNLHLLGRGAQFHYVHVHNLFAGARKLVERLFGTRDRFSARSL